MSDSAMIGIDLGTTNSLISVWQDGKSQLIPNGLGDVLTPSVVHLDKNGKILVGQAAKVRLLTQPESTMSVFKRLMGSHEKLSLGAQSFRPEELSSFVLRALKADAEAYLGATVSQAVISVPAYFNDAQRKATKTAGELAGLTIKRLINEPTAAALAYGLHQNLEHSTILVLDLGGGTFDVSLLELFEGIIEVHASCGDNYLGGEDFLGVIVDKFVQQAGLDETQLSATQRTQIQTLAEHCKLDLSQAHNASEKWQQADKTVHFDLDREAFESLCAPLIQRLRQPIEQTLMDGKMRTEDLDAIILVGGATRMPMIRSLVAKMFGRLPHCDLNPDEVVCQGAAIQAGLMQRDKALEETVLTDVCPYTLGIESMAEVGLNQFQSQFLPIIERNMPVPISRIKTVHPLHDEQTQVDIKVYQGESIKVDRNIKLGAFTVNLPNAKAHADRSIDIRFTYDINGILEVIAKLQATGEEVSLIIEQRPGTLSAAEIQERLKALAEIKIHPREEQQNQLTLSRAERLYEQSLGDTRNYLAQLITDFEGVLDHQDPAQIEPARQDLTQILDEIERHRTF